MASDASCWAPLFYIYVKHNDANETQREKKSNTTEREKEKEKKTQQMRMKYFISIQWLNVTALNHTLGNYISNFITSYILRNELKST